MGHIFVPQSKDPRAVTGPLPVCGICGELIPRLKGDTNCRWMKRKICREDTDEKPVRCMTIYRKTGHKRKPDSEKKPRKKTVEPKTHHAKPKPRRKMTESLAKRLDKAQAKLNMELNKKEDERIGLGRLPVKQFSKEELEAYGRQNGIAIYAGSGINKNKKRRASKQQPFYPV